LRDVLRGDLVLILEQGVVHAPECVGALKLSTGGGTVGR
jgi:hypothetical protein